MEYNKGNKQFIIIVEHVNKNYEKDTMHISKRNKSAYLGRKAP